MNSYGEDGQSEEEKMQVFENLGLKSDIVLNIFKQDLDNERASNNLLLFYQLENQDILGLE